jgi:hypothetical protein
MSTANPQENKVRKLCFFKASGPFPGGTQRRSGVTVREVFRADLNRVFVADTFARYL